eukprot:2702923-Amphidinium_carterae.4
MTTRSWSHVAWFGYFAKPDDVVDMPDLYMPNALMLDGGVHPAHLADVLSGGAGVPTTSFWIQRCAAVKRSVCRNTQ